MRFRVYSGPKGSGEISPIAKEQMLFKEFTTLDDALSWARHAEQGGRVPLLIEGDDGTRMDRRAIARRAWGWPARAGWPLIGRIGSEVGLRPMSLSRRPASIPRGRGSVSCCHLVPTTSQLTIGRCTLAGAFAAASELCES